MCNRYNESDSLYYLQGMDNIMETVLKDTNFFINMEFGQHLPVIQLVSFME